MPIAVAAKPLTGPAQVLSSQQGTAVDPAAAIDFASLLQDQLAVSASPDLLAAATVGSGVESSPETDDDPLAQGTPGTDPGVGGLFSSLANWLPVTPPVSGPAVTPADTVATDVSVSSLPTSVAGTAPAIGPGIAAKDIAGPGKSSAEPTAVLADSPNIGEKTGKEAKPDAAPANLAGTDASPSVPEKAEPTLSIRSEPSSIHGASPAAHLSAGSHLAAPQETPQPNLNVSTPIRDPNWSQDFGQRIVWLANADVQNAQVSINPPNLGPIDITIQIGGDQATAVFTSPHAEVREALENALPRLREMLAGAGINLGQANVNSQSQQQAGNGQQSAPGPRFPASDNAILSAHIDVNGMKAGPGTARVGLVDIFA